MENLSEFESDVLRKLVVGDDKTLKVLSEQIDLAMVVNREHTGVGEYVRFGFSTPVTPIYGNPSFCFGDVEAEIEGVPNGAEFLLWVENGTIIELEISTYQEEWPHIFKSYALRYVNERSDGMVYERDIASLRATAGWPRG